MSTRKRIIGAAFCLVVGFGCAGSGAGLDEASSDLALAVQSESDFVVLDRMGRPEMSNVTIGIGLKDVDGAGHVQAYNRQNTFHPKAGERAHAKRVLGAGIRASDVAHLGASGILFGDERDWAPDELELITDILSEDALVVDISKPCAIDTASFFDIEREEFLRRGGRSTDAPGGHLEHETCGGRTPNDDIIDDVLTMWIHKSFDFTPSNPRRVSDGIDKPSFGAHGAFPYLGDPNP
jgi:hypothetical protein